MNKRPLVIYHANCNDGFGAAYAAWVALRDTADYLPMSYGDPGVAVAHDELTFPVEVKNRDIYILDFSFPQEVMGSLNTACMDAGTTLTVLDHHKTHFEQLGLDPNKLHTDCGDNYYLVLDPNKSGCILAWEHFFPNEPAPLLLQHIDDRDRWQFKMHGTKEVHAFLSAQDKTFELWHLRACGITMHHEKSTGAAILRSQELTLASMLKATTRRIELDGVEGMCANLPPCFASDGGHLLCKESGTFGLTWYVTTDASVSCSLRSEGDFDVSRIAKLFGGGGHKNAAGFTLPGDQVVWFGAGFNNEAVVEL